MPSASTIFRWLLDERRKPFWEQYEKARNIQAELMFEELLEIADDSSQDYKQVTVARSGSIDDEDGDVATLTITRPNPEYVQRSRLRVDTRKWYLSKVLPKKFGDSTTLKGDPDAPLIPLALLARRAEQQEDASAG
ncbi:hypothetical protein JJE66_33815 [Bradyrhizobium diazoefficiens]|nr:hypothetical protein [Bradyrhizobium diazoefficiens]MBK3666186.1 hypothetical protein [Bradyrhizobium diazoefficiens]